MHKEVRRTARKESLRKILLEIILSTGIFIRSLGGIILLTLLLGGFLFTYRLSGGFLLREIQIEGLVTIPRSDLIQALELDYGKPMEDISDTLNSEWKSRFPQMDSIHWEKEFPYKIKVKVYESPFIAQDTNGTELYHKNGSISKSILWSQILPEISCSNVKNPELVTIFLGKFQETDAEAYRDIARVECDHGLLKMHKVGWKPILIFSPTSDPKDALRRIQWFQKNHGSELQQMQQIDVSDDGFLYAS